MRSKHAKPSGVGGRAGRLGFFSLCVGALAIMAIVTPFETATDSLLTLLRAVATVALSIIVMLWIRLPFVGIELHEERMVVHSWWTRRTILRADLASFQVELYTGFFFITGWTILDGRFASGHVQAIDPAGVHNALDGTVTNYRKARLLAESLNAWLGAEGADSGPRRNARSQSATPVSQEENASTD